MPFTLEFLGAEIGSNRTRLERAGVKNVGWSFHRLIMREKNCKTFAGMISSRVPDDMHVHLHPGLPSDYDGDLEAFAAQYEAFIVGNIESLASITEIDVGTPVWIYQQRKAFYDQMDPALFRPVWHATDGQAALQRLAETYEVVAIPEETISAQTTLSARVRALMQLHHTSFHAIGCAAPDNLRSIPFESASSMAWLAPQMRGETIVWDGNRLMKYPKAQKEQARKRHRNTYVQAGFDPDLIAQDDYNEVIASTIWSYLRLESSVSDRRGGDRPFTVIDGGADSPDIAANSEDGPPSEIAEHPSSVVDKRHTEMRNVPTPREPLERTHLPTMTLTTTTISEQGEHGPVLRDITVPSLGQATLRQCDTCFVAAQCPAMKSGSECAFHLPLEVRTKDQLKGLLQAIIEMQGQRIAFARFTEELNGGYPDPNVSSEMDRLFKLVKQLKELEDNREFIKITAERHAGGGVLSALFGDRAQAAAPALPHGGLDVDQTNTIISRSLD